MCDFFQMRTAIKRSGGVSTHTPDSKDARRKKFDDLFNN